MTITRSGFSDWNQVIGISPLPTCRFDAFDPQRHRIADLLVGAAKDGHREPDRE